jgi:hypothetical protein
MSIDQKGDILYESACFYAGEAEKLGKLTKINRKRFNEIRLRIAQIQRECARLVMENS